MQFQMDMSSLRFLVAETPEQRVDFDTKAPKVTEAGAPVFQAVLLAMDGRAAAPIKVSVAGDPGLAQGQFVQPVGLVLNVIDRKGDSIMWWTAERLAPEAAPGGSAKTGGGAGGKGTGQ